MNRAIRNTPNRSVRQRRPWTPYFAGSTARTRRREAWPVTQKGGVLIEAMVGVTVFLVGIVGLLAMQTAAVKNVSDSRFRADAALLTNQIIGHMWADDRANLSSYAHKASGSACSPSGSASSNARVTAWLSTVSGTLPGAASTAQQIIVDGSNKVTVSLCWQSPQDTAAHSHVVITQVQG